MPWKLVPAVTVVATMLGAAWLVLRPPDAAQVIVFFVAGFPSLAAGEAVMMLLAWLVVVVAACVVVLSAIQAMRRSPDVRSPASHASIFLAVGLLLLAVGAIRHSLPSASICCGSGSASIREVEDLVR